MKILITGGAGFIGSHVADLYIAEGHQVAVVDNFATGKRENVNPAVRLYHMNVEDPAIEEIFSRERPEVVNHHAAQIDVRKSVSDPVFDARINILGTLHLLAKAVQYGVRRFIFASSGGAIYGDPPAEGAAREGDPLRPMSPYGAAKAAGELYLYTYSVTHGLPYVALRYGNVYGPRQDPLGEAGVVAIFTQKLLRAEQPVINGDGRQTRDYVFVGDVARANLFALQPEVSGPFNIGTGMETDVNEIFHHLTKLSGKSVPPVYGPAKPGEQRRSVLDWNRARQELGWHPQVSLEEGLRRTVEFFKSLGK